MKETNTIKEIEQAQNKVIKKILEIDKRYSNPEWIGENDIDNPHYEGIFELWNWIKNHKEIVELYFAKRNKYLKIEGIAPKVLIKIENLAGKWDNTDGWDFENMPDCIKEFYSWIIKEYPDSTKKISNEELNKMVNDISDELNEEWGLIELTDKERYINTMCKFWYKIR